MSESAPRRESRQPLLPTAERAEVLLPTAEQAEPLRPGEKVRQLEQARTTVEKTLDKSSANPLERLAETERSSQPGTGHLSRGLRQASLNRELHEIRRRLPAPQRVLSRIVHQPTVRLVSEAAGRSVSRPSGLLGGSLAAFIGSCGYLYLAWHVGYRYNYLAFIIMLAGGFVVGVLLEGLVHLATRSRHQSD
jgi:hypothetical protein